jgi:hypothetical protein
VAADGSLDDSALGNAALDNSAISDSAVNSSGARGAAAVSPVTAGAGGGDSRTGSAGGSFDAAESGTRRAACTADSRVLYNGTRSLRWRGIKGVISSAALIGH